ncbi:MULTISPECIES: hypothetical protein [Pseudomonas]|uniref:Uncharacterized protein n=3 Tax=Pseudomonas TaxID=286 RepID=A0A2S9DQB9_PSECE|nr:MULTISPECIES: hypothetical protein [Pseudomonas]AVJ22564.1 hypothetical protein CLM72_12810 [Pseudomonas sp. MYb193]MBI6657044.1 hypothetical protein [Pseudomonas carnis]MBI6663975.1 hypothetical protein [Pseudomonas carnis]MBI6686053.1 hypothetical protein [Pseudomonas carnis]MBK3478796.1 hypothetical protein [Pseudomonas sp. MF6751]
MSVVQLIRKQKPRIANRYFKGEIDGADFTAKVFDIKKNEDRWTLTASKVDDDLVKHQIQLVFPASFEKRIYKLEEHLDDIRLTYSTNSLLDPILRYGASGLIDLTTVDPANTHVAGALQHILTRDDGNPVSTITALFDLS